VHSNIELEHMLEFTEELAMKAGHLIKELREKPLEFNYKCGTELVTSADLKSDDLIRNELKAYYPDIPIYSEESHADKTDFFGPLWIVDPIDGTVNYAHGQFNVSVSIAFAYKGELKLGVVYCPFLEEKFSALRGHGAYMNGKRIYCNQMDDLSRAVIATGFPYDRSKRSALMKRVSNILNNCQDIRRLASAAIDICWVACGRLEGYYETVSIWDMAAGFVIAKEAGALISNFGPEKPELPEEFNSECMLVSNPKLHDKLFDLLKE